MKLKIYLSIFAFIFSSFQLIAQKAEKIKGSKIVTTSLKEVQPFTTIEVKDNIEIYLEKGEKNEIKIEADDNLHDAINLEVQDKILIISTTKEVKGFKKLSVKVTYTGDLNLIITKEESVVNAIQQVILDNITFKALHKSKLFLNINANNFSLQADDKSKVELNLKGENCFIELSKNATLKALVNSVDLKCDLYQKAAAIIEGDSDKSILRIDNYAELNATNFNSKNTDITIEGSGSCSILVENSCIIDAADKSEISLYGNPTIEIRKFSGESKLFKKISPKK